MQVLLGSASAVDVSGQTVTSGRSALTYPALRQPHRRHRRQPVLFRPTRVRAARAGAQEHRRRARPARADLRRLRTRRTRGGSGRPGRRLTFTVIGAGATGVEMAGQIAELADHALKGEFRHIDSTQARVILLDDGLSAVLPPMGEKLRQEGPGPVGEDGRRDPAQRDGHRRGSQQASRSRIPTAPSGVSSRATKVWSAGVSASPLGRGPR